MTLHAQHEFSIPEETARVARAAYPKGNIYMKMRDALRTIMRFDNLIRILKLACALLLASSIIHM
ncbi:MAG: hypothetical protein ACJ795_21420 [Ktedonobacteraceae bacterium]|jgi:hypothetical protein